MRSRKLKLVGGTGLVLVSLYVAELGRSQQPESAKVRALGATAIARPSAGYHGPASCAATACHNAGGPPGSTGNEYSTWLLQDYHATRAYAVLTDRQRKPVTSDEIDQRYTGNPKAVAANDSLCLKCHSLNPEAHLLPDALQDNSSGHANVSLQREGVSCECCHGPSDFWLQDHFSRDWQTMTPNDKLRREFYLTKLPIDPAHAMRAQPDFAKRARRCASCHIGDGDREVNHALIAAGHPPLFFDYGAYESIYPGKHWHDDHGPDSDHAVRAWAIGVIADAKAAVTLTRERARKASEAIEAKATWPEFSEYSCFSCHRDLQNSQKPRAAAAKRRLGALPWSKWHTATLEFLAERGGPFAARDPRSIKNAVNFLRVEMEKPDIQPSSAVRLADELTRRLDDWLSDLSTNPKHADELAVRALMEGLRNEVKDPTGEGVLDRWESGMQYYLGLAACCNGLSDRGLLDAAQRYRMQEIRKTLSFPLGVDGPRDYRADDVRQKILAIEP